MRLFEMKFLYVGKSEDVMDLRYLLGNRELLRKHKRAFFASRGMPENNWLAIKQWADMLSPETDCIICGAHSPVEKQLVGYILAKKVPFIWMVAEYMPDSWPNEWLVAAREQRFLAVSYCDESVHYVSAASAYARNGWIATMADQIVVGYCSAGGNISRLLTNRKDVIYLNSVSNGNTASVKYEVTRLTTQNGMLFFDIEKRKRGGERLKVTQSKRTSSGFVRATMFIEQNELRHYIKEIQKIVARWRKRK